MKTLLYRREDATAYAARWAFGRNPRYLSFNGIGGDCTSFVSQCLFAGGGVMNYQKDVGWYYSSPANRAAAWSSVLRSGGGAGGTAAGGCNPVGPGG